MTTDVTIPRLAMLFFLLAAAAMPSPAVALDRLAVGKSSETAFTFVPLEIGEKAGIWAKNGISLDIIALKGGSQMQQALITGAIEVGLGSGTSLAFVAKGVPVKSIAAFAGPPKELVIVTGPDSPIRTIADLKDKKIGMTLAGSMADLLIREVARSQGWDPVSGIVQVPLGATRANLAAMKTGETDGFFTTIETGFQLEDEKAGRIVMNFGDVVADFITHAFYARDETIAKRPDVLRRFLTGWWQTIDYMKTHEDVSVAVGRDIVQVDPSVLHRTFPALMSMFLPKGDFDPTALKKLSRSFVELGVLDKEPDMASLYTTQFLPVQY
jgi:ABC-type nitrate/sulfonate/bicarbonate transport system substrate-binding protein